MPRGAENVAEHLSTSSLEAVARPGVAVPQYDRAALGASGGGWALRGVVLLVDDREAVMRACEARSGELARFVATACTVRQPGGAGLGVA